VYLTPIPAQRWLGFKGRKMMGLALVPSATMVPEVPITPFVSPTKREPLATKGIVVPAGMRRMPLLDTAMFKFPMTMGKPSGVWLRQVKSVAIT